MQNLVCDQKPSWWWDTEWWRRVPAGLAPHHNNNTTVYSLPAGMHLDTKLKNHDLLEPFIIIWHKQAKEVEGWSKRARQKQRAPSSNHHTPRFLPVPVPLVLYCMSLGPEDILIFWWRGRCRWSTDLFRIYPLLASAGYSGYSIRYSVQYQYFVPEYWYDQQPQIRLLSSRCYVLVRYYGIPNDTRLDVDLLQYYLVLLFWLLHNTTAQMHTRRKRDSI